MWVRNEFQPPHGTSVGIASHIGLEIGLIHLTSSVGHTGIVRARCRVCGVGHVDLSIYRRNEGQISCAL
jgi:hypothetical protein